MDDQEMFKLLTKFINNVFISKDDEDNSSDNRQVVEVNSSSSSTAVVISFLKQLCKMLKKKKISTNDLYFAFKDDYCKLNIVDDPCQIVAINQLTDQFKILYDLIKARLSINDIIQNPSISEHTRYDSDFREIKFIASGSFGNVYEVHHILDDHEYAIKKICVTFEKYWKIIKILQEVKTLAKLNHRNIISYKNAWIERSFSSVNKPTILNSSEEESSECSQNYDSHSYKESSSSSLSTYLDNCLGKFNIKDTNEPGCSTDIYVNTNKNRNNNSSSSDDDHDKHTKTCTNNYADHNGQKLKPSVISKKNFNDSNASYDNSTESTDSVVSFRNDSDENDKNNNNSSDSNDINSNSSQEDSEDSYISSGSPTSESDIEEVESDDTEKNMEENNSNVKQSNSQVCEYNSGSGFLILYIQMALCEQTLRKWLDGRKSITPVLTVHEIFMQILMGLEYIHSHGIIHHDIKPCNIFISTSHRIHIQIGDFGLACLTRKINGHTPFGTEMYAAPEQLAGHCDPKSDLYSLGIILMELLYPTTTLMELDKILKSLKCGEIPDTLEERYKKYGEIIIRLLVTDPNERPSATQLLEEFEKNKDFIIDKLESKVKEKDRDLQLLSSLSLVLLNMVKRESRGTLKIKRLVRQMKNKYKKK